MLLSNGEIRRKDESPVCKFSVIINRRSTSVSMEKCFKLALEEIAAERGMSFCALLEMIHRSIKHRNFSSALRQFAFEYKPAKITAAVQTDMEIRL